MQKLKVLLFVLLTEGIQAKGAKWQKLKPVHTYPVSAFHLKENITLFEIRKYEWWTKVGR